MYIHTTKNPNVKHDLRDRVTFWRIKNTFLLFRKAMIAVFNPNVTNFEFDKTDTKRPSK